MKRKAVFLSIGIITALLTLVSGCGSNNIGESLDTAGVSTGRLIVSITDDPGAEDIEKVWVTIGGLQVHMAGNEDTETDDGGWKELELVGARPDGTVRFDLLTLQEGLQKDLTVAELGIGKYTQIRMEVELVELDFLGSADDNALTKATLPSGKLKFIQPFELLGGQTTELLFDFDVMKSLNETGNGKWICKPVIKLDVVSQPILGGALAIITTSLEDGVTGSLYSEPISTSGGVTPFTWSWSANEGSALPAGLSLNPVTGIISGTPTVSGTYNFIVTAVDSAFPKNTATKSLTIRIGDVLQITTVATLPPGTTGTSYTAVLQAAGGIGPYTLSLVAPRVLPTGLTLISGEISGTITATAGTYQFTIKVTDSSNPAQEATQLFTLVIN